MKLIKALVALLVVAGLIVPAVAVAEDRLSLSGEMRVRGWHIDPDSLKTIMMTAPALGLTSACASPVRLPSPKASASPSALTSPRRSGVKVRRQWSR